MKVIASKVWNEPAVAIGLLTSIVLFVLQLIGDNDFTPDTIIAIVAPLATSLGIRGLVMPMSKLEESTKPEQATGTTYQRVPK